MALQQVFPVIIAREAAVQTTDLSVLTKEGRPAVYKIRVQIGFIMLK